MNDSREVVGWALVAAAFAFCTLVAVGVIVGWW